MKLRITIVLLGLAGAALLGAWRWNAAADAERAAAVEASRVRAWARAEGAAGVSALPKRVPAGDEGELRRLDGVPGFRDYATRCASCHVLPDPAAYRPKQWIGKVEEMRRHIERSGVMPPERSELEAVVEFLGQAADSLR